MSRKSTSINPETDADKVVEAIRVLSGTVEHASQHLELIGAELSRIRDELKWLCNEKAEVFRSIRKMPLDPDDGAWNEKLAAMNSHESSETVCCSDCDAECPSVAKALLAGWREIFPWQDGKTPFIGSCPAHLVWEYDEDTPGVPKPRKATQQQVPKPVATMNTDDLLRQVLNRAELNQDDLEPETQELLAKLHAKVTVDISPSSPIDDATAMKLKEHETRQATAGGVTPVSGLEQKNNPQKLTETPKTTKTLFPAGE